MILTIHVPDDETKQQINQNLIKLRKKFDLPNYAIILFLTNKELNSNENKRTNKKAKS